jgi:hypothetical protein
MATEKTIRGKGQWVKITRDAKRFTFARGRDGDAKAVEVTSWPIKAFTWSAAVRHARLSINTYA